MDRYFSLPARLEQAFEAHLHGDPIPEDVLHHLVECNVLMASHAIGSSDARANIDMPKRSALERTFSVPKLRLPVLLEVMLTVYWVRRQLRRRCISQVLDDFVVYALARANSTRLGADDNNERALLGAADAFWRARLYLPVELTCLLDSLALARFLARRGLSSVIVFGVMRPPFAAHCWVQAGDMALSDTVGGIGTYTPIRKLP